MEHQEVIEFLARFAVWGGIAWYVMRTCKAFMKPRLFGESFLDFLMRAGESIGQQAGVNARTMYGTGRKTMLINVINMTLLLSLCYLSLISSNVIVVGLSYLILGLIITKVMGVARKEGVQELRWKDHIWLRVFHAWFWPLYLWAWHKKI